MTNPPQSAVRRRRSNNSQASAGVESGGTSEPRPNDAAAQRPNRPQGLSPREAFRQLAIRFVFLFAMYQLYLKPKMMGTTNNSTSVNNAMNLSKPNSTPHPLLTKLGITQTPPPEYYGKPLNSHWPASVSIELRVFLSLEPRISFREAISQSEITSLWSLSSLTYSTDISNYRSQNMSVDVPVAVNERNASWFAHIFVAKEFMWNVDADSITDAAIEEHVLYSQHEITTWIDKSGQKKGKHLLSGGDDNDAKRDEKVDSDSDNDHIGAQCEDGETCAARTIISSDNNNATVHFEQRWKPSLAIVLVVSSGKIQLSQLPPAAAEKFRISKTNTSYFPPMHVEEFWQLRDSLQSMNQSVKSVKLEASFTPISLYKWSMYRQFDNVWQRQMEFGAIGRNEIDELKRMFVETNPILLFTTMIVSIAHTVLEALAFKNDISHWRNIKSIEGVSVRSMVWRIVMELVILLYLFDNETSLMITIGNAVGLLIEFWKLGKAVKFENFGSVRLLGFIPWFKVSDRESYSKRTKEYDEQAMRYLGYAVYPLVIGYALYSLKYDTHKSWYSWIINSLVGAVYAFGFIMMFPQIFINYKLKSVAHIPMKAMMYKTLNTVIDDLFSFIIKMPLLHRLACFRDDVVFLIILYQRWIYPVDKTRVNEFGQQFDEDGKEKVENSASVVEQSEQTEQTEPPNLNGSSKLVTHSDNKVPAEASEGNENNGAEESKSGENCEILDDVNGAEDEPSDEHVGDSNDESKKDR